MGMGSNRSLWSGQGYSTQRFDTAGKINVGPLTHKSLRRAIVLKEVLGSPLALRDPMASPIDR